MVFNNDASTYTKNSASVNSVIITFLSLSLQAENTNFNQSLIKHNHSLGYLAFSPLRFARERGMKSSLPI